MLYAIVGVLALLLDQITKYLTVANVALNTYDGPNLLGLVGITYIRNYGAAFGLLENKRWILFILLVVFLAVMIFLFLKGIIRTPFSRMTGALLMAGALGNGIDRAIYGYVVDMVEILPGKVRLPIFNLADCLITVCGILFCVSLILSLLRRGEDFEEEEVYEEERPRRPRRADPFSEPEEGAHDPFAAGRVPRRAARSEAEPVPARPRRPVQTERATMEDLAPARRPRPAAAEGEKAPVRRQRPAAAEGEQAPVRRQRPAAAEGEQAPVRRQRPAAAEGEQAPVRRQRPAAAEGEQAPVRRQRPAAAEGEQAPVRRPRPAAPAQQPVRQAPPAKKPAAPAPQPKAADEFDLDAILAEFK